MSGHPAGTGLAAAVALLLGRGGPGLRTDLEQPTASHPQSLIFRFGDHPKLGCLIHPILSGGIGRRCAPLIVVIGIRLRRAKLHHCHCWQEAGSPLLRRVLLCFSLRVATLHSPARHLSFPKGVGGRRFGSCASLRVCCRAGGGGEVASVCHYRLLGECAGDPRYQMKGFGNRDERFPLHRYHRICPARRRKNAA